MLSTSEYFRQKVEQKTGKYSGFKVRVDQRELMSGGIYDTYSHLYTGENTLKREVYQWLDNEVQYWNWDRVGLFYFDDENDALMFKLRWV